MKKTLLSILCLFSLLSCNRNKENSIEKNLKEIHNTKENDTILFLGEKFKKEKNNFDKEANYSGIFESEDKALLIASYKNEVLLMISKNNNNNIKKCYVAFELDKKEYSVDNKIPKNSNKSTKNEMDKLFNNLKNNKENICSKFLN